VFLRRYRFLKIWNINTTAKLQETKTVAVVVVTVTVAAAAAITFYHDGTLKWSGMGTLPNSMGVWESASNTSLERALSTGQLCSIMRSKITNTLLKINFLKHSGYCTHHLL
jgi:hypothetical protein